MAQVVDCATGWANLPCHSVRPQLLDSSRICGRTAAILSIGVDNVENIRQNQHGRIAILRTTGHPSNGDHAPPLPRLRLCVSTLSLQYSGPARKGVCRRKVRAQRRLIDIAEPGALRGGASGRGVGVFRAPLEGGDKEEKSGMQILAAKPRLRYLH